MLKNEIIKNNKDICILTDRYLDIRTEKFGLTAAQGLTLAYIIGCGGADTSDICREFGISKSTVSAILKRLSSKDFITAETLKEDNRRKRILPTQKARRVKSSLLREFSLCNEEVFGSFSEAELKTAAAFQEKLLNALRRNLKNYMETEEM